MSYFTSSQNWSASQAMKQDESPYLSDYKPNYTAFEGLGSSLGGALAGTLGRTSELVDLAAATVIGGAAKVTGSQSLYDLADYYFAGVSEASAAIEDQRSLASGWASQTLFNVLDVGASYVAGGPVGASVAQAAGRGIESVNQGDSAGTAAALTALAGITTYAGVKMPAAFGSGLATKLISGAGGNVAMGFGGRIGEKAIYELSGQDQISNSIKIADPVAVSADAILGAFFGSMHSKAESSGKPYHGLVHKWLTTEKVDAAISVKKQQLEDTANPIKTDDPIIVNASREAIDEIVKADLERREPDLTKIEQIAAKEKDNPFKQEVDVKDHPELSSFAKIRNEIRERVSAENKSEEARFHKLMLSESVPEGMKLPLNPAVDSLDTAIRKLKGLNKKSLSAEGVDPRDMTTENIKNPGWPLFSEKGFAIDNMVEALNQYGFNYDVRSLREALDRSMSGNDVYSSFFEHRQTPSEKEIVSSLKEQGVDATVKDIKAVNEKVSSGKNLTEKQQKIADHINEIRKELQGIKNRDLVNNAADQLRAEGIAKANDAFDSLKGDEAIRDEQLSIEDSLYQEVPKQIISSEGVTTDADAEIALAMADHAEAVSVLDSMKKIALCLVG